MSTNFKQIVYIYIYSLKNYIGHLYKLEKLINNILKKKILHETFLFLFIMSINVNNTYLTFKFKNNVYKLYCSVYENII